MTLPKNLSLSDINIIDTISDSKKSTVSLVSVCDSAELAVLKQYHTGASMDFFNHLRQLHSNYLPEIYQIWEENGDICLLEEYLSGKTLSAIFDANIRLRESDVTHYMQALCLALRSLHTATPPIIHRDLKPENIMITDNGYLKLLDFDAAREYKRDQTQDTILLGTKEYAAPEQFGFTQTDERSDIYSLGIVFSELLEHAGVSSAYTKKAHKIIDRATMFDPDRRYPDTVTLQADIERLKKSFLNTYWPFIGASIAIIIISIITLVTIFSTNDVDIPTISDNSYQYEPAPPSPDAEHIASRPTTSPTPTPTPTLTPTPTPTPTPLIGPVHVASLSDSYEYTDIYDEYRVAARIISATRPYLYDGIAVSTNEHDGFYTSRQETVIGKDYNTVRFLQAYPRDLYFSDVNMEGGQYLNGITICPFDESTHTDGRMDYLPESAYTHHYGNVVSISADYLQTLEPGYYTITIRMTGFHFSYYLVVHAEDDKIDNFRPEVFNWISYYSSEKQNDVLFFVGNTPYTIKDIRINSIVLDESCYELIDDGYGILFHPDFLEQYTDRGTYILIITMQNGKEIGVRIINTSHYAEQ